MAEGVAELTRSIHELAAGLPRFDHRASPADLPPNGIYLFFEHGEMVPLGTTDAARIVRVGTHRVDGRFPRRVRYHFHGDRQTSVFRWHLGAALLARRDQLDPRLSLWRDRTAAGPSDVEALVSHTLYENFAFACVRVESGAERIALERGLIALLAQRPAASPSEEWLGRHALAPSIRESGLWNTQGIRAAPLSPREFDRFSQLVTAT